MASDLKWRTGLGWDAIALILSAAIAAWLSAGVVRWLAAGIVPLIGAYMTYRYRQWNRDGWRRVHGRAMLAYAEIAAREEMRARQSNGEFDIGRACAQLGLLLCGEDKQAAVDAMLDDLTRAQGAYLAALVERHGGHVLPGAPFELRRDLTLQLREMRFGPHLVIASVIENIYGGPEAARYALAVATGTATVRP